MFILKKNLMALMLVVFATSLVGCGVKGPPEAPYPTEATTKKDISGSPAAVPFAVPKTTEEPILGSPPAKKSKKKSQ